MTGQSEQFLECPYCGERISVLADHSIADQRYVEDCEVCCRPIEIRCEVGPDSTVRLSSARADD